MTLADFNSSLSQDDPPVGLPLPLQSLWWDAKGDWDRAHALVNDLGTPDAMSVHAYLHRKEGDEANASYWYRRASSGSRRQTLAQEWAELVAAQLADED